MIDDNDTTQPTTIKLWDVPVRLIHWAFVALIPALWWTGERCEAADPTSL